MRLFCLCPCQFTGMVIRIDIAIKLSTDLAGRFFGTGCCSSTVGTYITALCTDTLLPLVVFFGYGYFTTAGVFLFVRLFCLCPCQFAGMVIRIDLAVKLSATLASRLFCTGRCSSGTLFRLGCIAAVYGTGMGMCTVSVRCPCAPCMGCIYGHCHLKVIAPAVRGNNFLRTGFSGQRIFAICIRFDFRAVYSDLIYTNVIRYGKLCTQTICLSILQTMDHR